MHNILVAVFLSFPCNLHKTRTNWDICLLHVLWEHVLWICPPLCSTTRSKMLSASTTKAMLTVLLTSLDTCYTPWLGTGCWIIALGRESLLEGRRLVDIPALLLVGAGGNMAVHLGWLYKGCVSVGSKTQGMGQVILGPPGGLGGIQWGGGLLHGFHDLGNLSFQVFQQYHVRAHFFDLT